MNRFAQPNYFLPPRWAIGPSAARKERRAACNNIAVVEIFD